MKPKGAFRSNLLRFLLALGLVPGVQVLGEYRASEAVAQGLGNCGTGFAEKVEVPPFSSGAPSGQIVVKVIIKAGSQRQGQACFKFTANVSDGCYMVAGLGTGTATATKVGPDTRACKDIGHAEFYTSTTTAILHGPPGDPANAHIPDIPIPDAFVSDVAPDDRPGGTLLPTSRTRILLLFTPSATVGQVNALLSGLGASIIGSVPTLRVVLIAIPTNGTFGPLDDALAVLQASPAIALAAQDIALGDLVISVPSTAADPNVPDHSNNIPEVLSPNPWRWNFEPSHGGGTDGNWGLVDAQDTGLS